MFTSIRVKSTLFLGLFIVGSSCNSLICKQDKHAIKKESSGNLVTMPSDQLRKKLQNPLSLKKIITAFFTDNNDFSAHNYRALFLFHDRHPAQNMEVYFDGKKITLDTNLFLARQSLLISNTAFQEAAIQYFLTHKDYKPYGWQSLADTTLITQPKVRKTILQEIQKVLQRPAARLSNQFIDSIKHVINGAKNNYDIALLNEIQEVIEKYSRPTEKQQLLILVHAINKPTRHACFDECVLSIDHDTNYAQATLDIRQNAPYDVVTLSTQELTEKLNNPHDRLRIIDNLFNSPYVSALDLIHDKKIASVQRIEIKNIYAEPNQTFSVSSNDVLTNRSLLFSNQQVIEALAYYCIQAILYNTNDAGLVISIGSDKTLTTAPLFKELVVKGIIKNFSNIQKPSSYSTFSVLCHLIIDLIRCKNEELLTQLITVIKQNQHKSAEYAKLIQTVENDRTQIESQILEEDHFLQELESAY